MNLQTFGLQVQSVLHGQQVTTCFCHVEILGMFRTISELYSP